MTKPAFLMVLSLLAWVPDLRSDDKAAVATPEAVARTFFSETRRASRSLPSEEELTALSPFMSAELIAAFRRAQTEKAEFMKKHPDEKPPWTDNDLFSSLYEGPQTFKIEAAKVTGERAEVPVACAYTEKGETVKWTDTLILLKTAKGWLVDDIRFGGTWGFANQGTLKEGLAAEVE